MTLYSTQYISGVQKHEPVQPYKNSDQWSLGLYFALEEKKRGPRRPRETLAPTSLRRSTCAAKLQTWSGHEMHCQQHGNSSNQSALEVHTNCSAGCELFRRNALLGMPFWTWPHSLRDPIRVAWDSVGSFRVCPVPPFGCAEGGTRPTQTRKGASPQSSPAELATVHWSNSLVFLFLIQTLFLVARPGGQEPLVTSLLPVAMPGAPSSVLVPGTNRISPSGSFRQIPVAKWQKFFFLREGCSEVIHSTVCLMFLFLPMMPMFIYVQQMLKLYEVICMNHSGCLLHLWAKESSVQCTMWM